MVRNGTFLLSGYGFSVSCQNFWRCGAKSKYIPYGSDEAMLLPSNHRTAALQDLCLRHMVQNLETILQYKLIPSPITSKCGSLIRLGFKPPVAGVARRPILPNPSENCAVHLGLHCLSWGRWHLEQTDFQSQFGSNFGYPSNG